MSDRDQRTGKRFKWISQNNKGISPYFCGMPPVAVLQRTKV